MPLPPPLPSPLIPSTQIHLTSRLLGRGSFGTVYRGYYSGLPVAIKACPLYPTSPSSKSAFVQFRRESHRYTLLRHPSITQFFAALPHPQSQQLLLVTELMKGGSLYDALSKFRSAHIRQLQHEGMLRIAIQITNGLSYLHASDFSFGDLKTMNVLLSGGINLDTATFPTSTRAKLCDFGLSRNLKHLVPQNAPLRPDETIIAGRNGPAGTFAYMSPESFAGLPTDDADAPKQADVFALAVCLWELATLDRPWRGKSALQLIRIVGKEGKRLQWYDGLILPEGYKDLVESCWRENAHDRPCVDQVVHQLTLMYQRAVKDQSEGIDNNPVLQRRNSYEEFDWESTMNSAEGLSEIKQVDSVELSNEEFAAMKMRMGLEHSVSASEPIGTQLSDVTGESHGVVEYVEGMEGGKLSIANVALTQEKDHSGRIYVDNSEGYKSYYLGKNHGALASDLDRELESLASEFDDGTYLLPKKWHSGPVEKRERGTSYLIPKTSGKSEDQLDRELDGLFIDGENAGQQFIEMSEGFKAIEGGSDPEKEKAQSGDEEEAEVELSASETESEEEEEEESPFFGMLIRKSYQITDVGGMEDELWNLEEEEELNFASVGVDMYCRPHFR